MTKNATKYINVTSEKLKEIVHAKLPSLQNYHKTLSAKALKHQSRLFQKNLGHLEARGSVTFIKYNFKCYAITNAHCLFENDSQDEYFTAIPMKKSKKYVENERNEIKLKLICVDKVRDLAVFNCDKKALYHSKRSFLELYPYTSNDFEKSPFTMIIGVPGERLGYYYGDENTDYTNLEKIIMNHVTLFSAIMNSNDTHHEIKVSSESFLLNGITPENLKENDTLFDEHELSNKIKSLAGLSGSPCFNFNYKNLNNFNLNYLGMVSNGTVESETIHVISVNEIKDFLNEIN